MSEIVERGNIYFFYRPRTHTDSVEGLPDVRRLYILLSPEGGPHRLIELVHQRLPEVIQRESTWGLVTLVDDNEQVIRNDLDAITAGGRLSGPGGPEAGESRPAGEGRYEIVHHGKHSDLAYVLELPDTPGPVQEQLRIPRTGALKIAVKNPLRMVPPGFLDPEAHEPFPAENLKEFGVHDWVDVDKSDLLNHRLVPILFTAVESGHVSEVTEDIHPEPETAATAGVYEELGVVRDEETVKPLVSGEWK